MQQKIFITGGTGFIGKNLIKFLLEKGYDIGALLRINSRTPEFAGQKNKVKIFFYDGTIGSIHNALLEYQPNIVIHLATFYKASHQQNEIDAMIESNISFGTKLLEAMLQNQKYKLINVGTLYQNYNNETYYPVNLYSAMKQSYFDIIRYYSTSSPLRVVNLKFLDTYGVNDTRPKILNILIDAALNGTTLDMSPGNQYVDLVYIEDVMSAFTVAIERLNHMANGSNECYSIHSVQPIRLRKLVDVVSNICGKEIKINWGKKEYRKIEVMEPITCVDTLPGWSQKIFLEDGIKRLLKSK